MENTVKYIQKAFKRQRIEIETVSLKRKNESSFDNPTPTKKMKSIEKCGQNIINKDEVTSWWYVR